MRYSPSHPANDLPRKGHIAVLTHIEGKIPEITDEEREVVCQAIDKRGLWGTDIAEMLGLVERQPEPVVPEPSMCRQGHDQDEHGGVRGDGRRYCLACNRETSRAHYRRLA